MGTVRTMSDSQRADAEDMLRALEGAHTCLNTMALMYAQTKKKKLA